MKDIVVFGAGGLAKEVLPIIDAINETGKLIRLIAFVVDDKYYKPDMEVFNKPLTNRNWLISHKDDVECVCAIGYPIQRMGVQQALIEQGIRFTSLIHPNAKFGANTQIGYGCIIQNCSISVDCKIGNGVFINDDVLVGHDVIIEDYVSCFPRAQISGKCIIGKAASIGAMTFINEKCRVGEMAVVAPGSIVFCNVKKNTHVIGNPARRIEI